MHHDMRLFQSPFERIRNGTKTIELRLYDEKRRKVSLGDIIRFNYDDEKIFVRVTGLLIYPTFEDLISDVGLAPFGYDENFKEEFIKRMYNIYTKEKEEKYGVVGIKIKIVSDY